MPERKVYPLIGVLMGRKKKKEKIQIRKLPLQGDDPLFCPCRPHLRFYSGLGAIYQSLSKANTTLLPTVHAIRD